MRTSCSTLLFFLFLAIASCTTHVEALTDSIVVSDTIYGSVETVSPFPFPDTTMRSAERIMFVIDTFEKEIPGVLSHLWDDYEGAPGVFTFRGAPSRNPNFRGMVHGDSINIHTDWVFVTDFDTVTTFHGQWGGGTGWTGQPLFVHWPDSLMPRFLEADSLDWVPAQKEIIVASLCGYVYFIDFETGKPTRNEFDTKNVLKGTPSLNPSLNGDLYIGHGVQKQRPFGHLVYNLFTNRVTHTFGRDSRAWRSWGAYDSSPVVAGGFLFRPGENGTLYKYYIADGGFRLHSTLRYSLTKRRRSQGIEASMAVCGNYGYLADNGGNVLCVNLNTLCPVWHYKNRDDTDATPVVELEAGIPYVYTGCEVDRQGAEGLSHFVKLNGLTGAPVWDDTIRCQRFHYGEKTLDGGMFSTPLLGAGDCSDMIFTHFCINTTAAKGQLIAFDKSNGDILYRTNTKQYCWSSPVPFFNEDNEMFIFTADCAGNVYLIKAKTGEIVDTKRIGGNFESSPIIVEDHIILGSRGNKIYKISLE